MNEYVYKVEYLQHTLSHNPDEKKAELTQDELLALLSTGNVTLWRAEIVYQGGQPKRKGHEEKLL
jgi:hypothetical protein